MQLPNLTSFSNYIMIESIRFKHCSPWHQIQMHITFNTYPFAAYIMTLTHFLFHWTQFVKQLPSFTQVLW